MQDILINLGYVLMLAAFVVYDILWLRSILIAEMSFLTGKTASADVYANGTVRYIAWNQKKLKDCERLNPQLPIKIQNVLGKDLADKIHTTSHFTQ